MNTLYLIGALILAAFGFGYRAKSKNTKIKNLKNQIAVEEVKDEIMEDMERSVPEHFHIDRMLGRMDDTGKET